MTFISSVVISLLGAVATSFLTLGKYKEKVDQLEKREEKTGEKIDCLRSDVDKLMVQVASLEKKIDSLSNIAQSHSPLALTDKGWALVKDSGAFTIYDAIKDELIAELELQDPRSQYDVQEKARWMMGQKFNDDRFRAVEDWAYEHGEDFGQILRSLGLPLRDYYFKKHPEIVNSKEQY